MKLNSRGSSLVATLVASGFFLVICGNVFNLLSSSLRSTKILDQKRALSNLRTYIASALRDGNVCTMTFTQPGSWITGSTPVTFDETLVTTSTPPKIPILKILTKAHATAPAVITVGQPIDSQTPYLVVSEISLLISGGSGTSFSGSLDVHFDPTILGRSIAPISFNVSLTTTSASPRAITLCAMPSTGGGSLRRRIFTADGTFVVPPGAKKIKATVVGAGGGGAGGTGGNRNLTPGATCTSGGSGGGGGTAICLIDATPGSSYSITIGQGGAAGNGSGPWGATVAPTNGGDGTTSEFGPGCRATGGRGGRFGINGIFSATGMDSGAGGNGITGPHISTIPGHSGNWGLYINSCWSSRGMAPGQFGGSAFGGGSVYGTGGFGGVAGGDYGLAGQPGQNGAVFIDWVE